MALATRLKRTDIPATSRVAYAEVAAAVARRCREGELGEADRDRILAALALDFEALLVVDVTAELVRQIPRLVVDHPLRGFDAVHLASALLLADGDASSVTFASADSTLNIAAGACGFSVWDPSTA